MLIHKFGGTSVEGAERIQAVAGIVAGNARPAAVITSAMGGVTDRLIDLAWRAQAHASEPDAERFEALRARHLDAAAALVADGAERAELVADLEHTLSELRQILHGVRLLQELSPRSLDLVMSFGERLAAPLLAAALRARGVPGVAVDARTLLRTDDGFGHAVVDHQASRELARAALLPLCEQAVPVVTGFIAQSVGGATTTLGRGGSDYSAALFGAYLEADEIWIWTDVVGVMTADPRVVPEAQVLDSISYREAAEMAYFGSKVLHPSTMIPAVEAEIPIRIRSSLEPEQPGTLITHRRQVGFEGVKTVTSIPDMALVTIEGRGMMGVPGVARRAFTATAQAGVNVYMISQASSEQNISFLVKQAKGAAARAELEREFELELLRNRIDRIDVKAPVGILAIIGEGMQGSPGISQRLFTALGKARVNVLAIAQGSSELNVSVVVDQDDLARAVGATHSGFGLTSTTHVFLLGKGLIARTLLGQLRASQERLRAEHGIGVSVIGLCGRDRWLFNPHGLGDDVLARLAAGEALDALGGEPRPGDDELLERIVAARRLDVVLVDVTDGETSALHLAAVRQGLHVVSANKKPLAGSLEHYRSVRREAQAQGVGYHFETTFGAGLPVLFTLQDLLATHDRVERITGCFSGTLGFIASGLQAGRPLSALVVDAKARGFTEPDPREDLSGRDVARKALIIAREIGLELEMADVRCDGLVPAELMALPDVQSFMRRLHELDDGMAQRVEQARAQSKVLRYLAEITPARVTVGLRAVDQSSAEGQLDGPDNILVYQTERYHEHPLVIRGPGAGAEVTAAGVFGDILKVARRV